MINEYDEIKNLLKKSKLLFEQPEATNIARSIENRLSDKYGNNTSTTKTSEEDDIVKKEKSKSYRISGGLLTIHSTEKKELELTREEKSAFQETMDEFVAEVSDLSDFGVLNMYENDVQWSGKIVDMDIEFFFSIGEKNGVYINGDMIKLDEKLTELMGKLTSFYEKFKAKWAKVISLRKKTKQKKI